MERLEDRIEELEIERRRLLALVELLRELAGCLNYRDIVQTVARRLGYTLGLDRCSVFLCEKSRGAVHLVASYEDPSLRNHQVDLARYPELRRALETSQVVVIPDVIHEPSLEPVHDTLASRRVQSITVIPLVWRTQPIGALFLRTDRTRALLEPADVQWAKVVADVTARSLRAAHRIERLEARARGGKTRLAIDRERAALLEFIRRLLTEARPEPPTTEELPRASHAELERLVGVALTVLRREAGQ
jgi:GAF domain-containing protein